LREAQQVKLHQQAEAEKTRKLDMEKKALADERAQALIDAQIYQEKKLREEARAKAAQDAAQRAHDVEIAQKRQELQQVRSMEEILAAEEQLNYLEDLLRSNPRAAVPGLDPRRLTDEPTLLPHVLRLVEDNIRRPEGTRHSARTLQESLERERADKERRERLHKHEQELNRLEMLLTQHPQATIKGLDLSRLNSDPNILQQALRHVDDCIRRGENPLEIPLPGSGQPLLNEARVRDQRSDGERSLVHRFLQITPEEQIHYLRSFPNHAAQDRFLQGVMEDADLPRGQQIIDRFTPYGFNLQLSADAASRPPPFEPAVAPSVPTIIVDQLLSPPPTQDTETAYPFPSMSNTVAADNLRAGWKGKGRETQDGLSSSKPTYVVIDNHSISTPHLPSPPTTTPGRTSVAHPSAAATAAAAAASAAAELLEKQQDEDDLAAEEAELERERQEIVEAEEALSRAENEQATIEAQRRAEEAAVEALRAQDEARDRAAAELEEAAQAQALEMAEAESATRGAWSPLSDPPADFVAKSPALAPLPTPPVELVTPAAQVNDPWGPPPEDPIEEPANIENDPAWGEASAQINDAWGSPKSKGTPVSVSSKAASVKPATSRHSSPKASSKAPSVVQTASPARIFSKAASPAAGWSPLPTPVATPNVASINANKLASPVMSVKAVSIHSSSHKAASIQSPSVKASTIRSPSVKAVSPLIPASSKSRSPSVTSVLSHHTPSVHSIKEASPRPTSVHTPPATSPVLSIHSTPRATTPATLKNATPVAPRETSPFFAPDTISASPARSVLAKATSPSGTPKAATPRLSTPALTPKANTPAAAPTAPLASELDAWGAGTVKTASPAKSTVSEARDAWGPPLQSNKAVTPAKSPADVITDAWGSPKAASSVAKSPSVASNKVHNAWGSSSPAKTATPLLAPVVSPKPTSPTKSTVSKASTAKANSLRDKLVSPAFGLAAAGRSSQSGQTTPEHIEGPRTAVEGSDPVVVSMTEPVTPYEVDAVKVNTEGAAQPEAYPDEEYEDYSEDGEEVEEDAFDPEDYPIYMKGDPLPPGYRLLETSQPHAFQERYPKSGPDVSEEKIFNYFAEVA